MDIHRDEEGNYYLVGSTLGFMEFPKLSVYKMDAKGKPQWYKTVSANTNTNLGTVKAVSTTSALIVIAEGNFGGSITARFDKQSGNVLNGFVYQNSSSGSAYSRFAKKEGNHIIYSGDRNNTFIMASFDTLGKPNKIRSFERMDIYRGGALRDGFFYGWTTHFDGNAHYSVILKTDTALNIMAFNMYDNFRAGYPNAMDVSEEGNVYAWGNMYAPGKVEPFLMKFNSEAELGSCSFTKGAPIVVDHDPQAKPITFTTVPKGFNNPVITIGSVPDTLGHAISELLCSSATMCTSIKVEGAASVCRLEDDYTIRFHRNAGCTMQPIWIYDTSIVVIIKATDTSAVFRFKKQGACLIKAKLNAGCSTFYDSLKVQAYDTKSASLNLGKDTVLCQGNTMTLRAGGGYSTYLWQDGSTDSTYRVEVPGTYHVQAMDGCGRAIKDTILVRVAPPIAFSVGPDRSKCNLDTVQLSAPTGFLNYNWTAENGRPFGSEANLVINPNVTSTYFIKAEKTPGCFAYDTVQVTVNHSPLINLGNDTTLCIGDSLLLNAGSGFSRYLWDAQMGERESTSIVARSNGAYSVQAWDGNGCMSKDTLWIRELFALPVITLNKDTSLCMGTSRTLSAGSGFTAHKWSTGAVTSSISVNQTGSYKVQVTDRNGCRASDSVHITRLLPLPSAFLPPDARICAYESLSLKPNIAFKQYQWSNGAAASQITVSAAGLYWLEVIDANNCRGRDSIEVIVKQGCVTGFHVPTAFTPDRNGKNDLFRPLLFGEIKQYQFTVYNRWGEVVFRSTELGKGWDGKFLGKPQDTNVFVWTCLYQMEGTETKSEKGTVVLIR